jgi:hypothetical protein
MISYLKKLISGKYRHEWYMLHFPWVEMRFSPPLRKCKKCNKWCPYWFPELYLCSMSEDEWIIKQILE